MTHDPPPGWPCTRDSEKAVIGGFVYRGERSPELRGKYVLADGVDGRIFYADSGEMRRGTKRRAKLYQFLLLDEAGRQVTMPDLAGDSRVDLRFGTTADGELYILSKANGKIWKVTGARYLRRGDVFPTLARNLVAHYDFEDPVAGNAAQERDRGLSGTDLQLVNGGAAARVRDGAHQGSAFSMETRQVNPTVAGNDDWKAGLYSTTGVRTLTAFNRVRQVTIMGWFKMTGQNPSPNSNSANPDDFYGAIGLAGILSGDSNGHTVRALLELIEVEGTLRVVALGRRIDGGASQTFAASEDWRAVLPPGEWVFLAATFDFDKGTMAFYKNGRPLAGSYVVPGDPWGVATGEGPYFTSATDPRGIKIGGSFPQNTREGNPCNCRFDSLMFLDRAATRWEILAQYYLARTG